MSKPAIKFNELSIADKALLVAEYGQFLLSTEYYNYRVHLYTLNGDFIEVFYNIMTRQVEAIALAAYDDLDKHIQRIHLSYLNR